MEKKHIGLLSSGFMITSILGFLISIIYIMDISETWGFTLTVVFLMMFISSFVNMHKASISDPEHVKELAIHEKYKRKKK
jgi:galactitol-specific phosphotransferase system IIC component